MFIRFVVGLDDENHRSLTGLITEARLLRDAGSLDQLQVSRLEATYAWFNENLPTPLGQSLESNGARRRGMRRGQRTPAASRFRPKQATATTPKIPAMTFISSRDCDARAAVGQLSTTAITRKIPPRTFSV
jgi:hypothetical protein